ncbi:hypothetical protein Bca4012_084599 [Brassica carinata]
MFRRRRFEDSMTITRTNPQLPHKSSTVSSTYPDNNSTAQIYQSWAVTLQRKKGKVSPKTPNDLPRFRIRAPEFDPADLIKENALTLVGRLTNPKEQRMSAVLPYLPKLWNMIGRTTGSDLGNGCFQFRFENEADLHAVLQDRPYQFGRWMLLIQRWEPIISSTFPSQIPFWITLKGIPLHYWHEKVVRNLGMEFGELEDYAVTRSSARVRVTIDGLKPLAKEFVMEFDSGEESLISMEYERLGNHCSICNRLTHLRFQCPDRQFNAPTPILEPQQEKCSLNPTRTVPNEVHNRTTTTHKISPPRAFHQRLDRHGKPFGERVSSAYPLVQGPKNKIAPGFTSKDHYRCSPHEKLKINEGKTQLSARRRTPSPPQDKERIEVSSKERYSARNSPPYARARNKNSASYGKRKREIFPALPPEERGMETEDETNNLNADLQVTRNQETPEPHPLPEKEIPLEVSRGQATIPSTEEVMEELRAVTYQYVDVADPKEREARRQRVLDGEIHGLMAETAANIIASAVQAQQQREQSAAALLSQSTIVIQPLEGPINEPSQPLSHVIILPDTPTANATKRRGFVRTQTFVSALDTTSTIILRPDSDQNPTSPTRRAKGGFSPPASSSSLAILSWNCCGLGNPATIQRLRDIRHRIYPDLLFLMETKNPDSFVTDELRFMD